MSYAEVTGVLIIFWNGAHLGLYILWPSGTHKKNLLRVIIILIYFSQLLLFELIFYFLTFCYVKIQSRILVNYQIENS